MIYYKSDSFEGFRVWWSRTEFKLPKNLSSHPNSSTQINFELGSILIYSL